MLMLSMYDDVKLKRDYRNESTTVITTHGLMRAKIVRGFQYREYWTSCDWEIGCAYDDNLAALYRGLHWHYAKSANIMEDNHQSFIVKMDDTLYWVMFHDWTLVVGLTAADYNNRRHNIKPDTMR